MDLTAEQIQAIRGGVPVRVVPSEIGAECIVVRADVFQRVDGLLHDLDPRQAYPAVDEAWKEGWDDPKMADYDHYEDRRQ